MIGIPVALLYANAFEWWAHKYLLHGLGKKKGSFFAFHFHDHHRASRKHGMIDEGADERLLVPAAFDKFRREPIEQLGVTRPFALRSEVGGCRDDSGAKEERPEAVHRDAGGQRILRIDQPVCKVQTIGLFACGERREDPGSV